MAPAGLLGASSTTAAADLWLPTTAPSLFAPELGSLADTRAATFEIVGRLEASLVSRWLTPSPEVKLTVLQF